MSDRAEILFESYNFAIENGYDKAFENSTPEEILKGNAEEIRYITDEIKKWEDTPLKELGGLSPREYFQRISDFNEVIGLFIIGSDLCDKDLPQLLTDKLASFGQAADKLIELASDHSSTACSGEESYARIMAVRVLGNWREEKAAGQLVKIFLKCDKGCELLTEEIIDALINIGEPSVDPILKALEAEEGNGYLFEQLLGALAGIGKKSKSEQIFGCLKDSFLRMENKLLGAMYLGDYGDGRAIPVLRGYVEKNIGSIDKETFYQIKSEVKRLGGKMDDIKFQ